MSDLESTLHVTATLTRIPKGTRILLHVDGEVTTRPLPRRGTLTIGRAASSDITIDHPSVSRSHARLGVGPPLAIEDLGSHNGTRVRGRRLEPHQRAPLTLGDVVKIGSTWMMIQTGEVHSDTGRLLSPAFVEARVDAMLAEGRGVDVFVVLARGPLPPDVAVATLAAAVPRDHLLSSPEHDELVVVLLDADDAVDSLRERLEAAALGVGIRVGLGHASAKARTRRVRDLVQAAHKSAAARLAKRTKPSGLLTRHQAVSLMNASIGLYAEERYEQARAMADASLELLADDDGAITAMCLMSVAVAAKEHGDLAHAARLLERAVAIAREAKNAGAEALALEELAACRVPEREPPRGIVLFRRARKLAVGRTEVDLSRRGPLWQIVVALARQRAERPDEALDRAALLEAGWPGERIHPDAALNRLYVAIATLRRLGLRDVVLNRSDGYFVDGNVAVTTRD
jgi:hypothetical protein